MRVGILGSGLMGAKLGAIFARAGHEVVFSYTRSKEKLKKLTHEGGANARTGTPVEAVRDADAILLAVHWSRMRDVLDQAGDLSGKVIVTCSLPMNADETALVIRHGTSGSEELAKMIPGARIVCAFNTVPSEVLFDVFEARHTAPRPSLVYCGDDSGSKEIAAGLIRDAGFEPVDAGPLRIARYRTIRTPDRPARVWWRRWPGTGVPLRKVWEMNAVVPEIAGWDGFYQIVGAAAGALIGLQFVVMTLINGKPGLRAADASAAFATPVIVHFGTVLLLSAFTTRGTR